MKKRFTLAALTVLVLILTINANAKIRRVGYFGTPVTNTDYTDLQSAHDAAAAGDTIFVYPGSWNATYSKKLITIGYGYFVDTSTLHKQANAGLQNITASLQIYIVLAAGSNNSVFEGLDGFNLNSDGSGATYSGIIVRRCNGYVDLSQNNSYSGWQILQCYLSALYLNYNSPGTTISNLTVSNCYISGIAGSNVRNTNGGQFINNVLEYAEFNNGTYLVKNNIILGSHSNDFNCVYQNNVYSTDWGTISGTGNVGVDYNTTMLNSVFVGYGTQGSFSNDARWTLKAGSPAKSAGSGGSECGMFGGTNPYKLSGIPRVPSFYKLTSSSTTASTNPYTVTFSVRSNN